MKPPRDAGGTQTNRAPSSAPRRAPRPGSAAWCRLIDRAATRLTEELTAALPAAVTGAAEVCFRIAGLAVALGRTLGWAACGAADAARVELLVNEALAHGLRDYVDFARARTRNRCARRRLAELDQMARRIGGPINRSSTPTLTIVR